MADAFIQLPPNSTGLKLDTSELVVGANTVERERINIADPTNATRIATVTAANELNVIASAQPGVDIGDVTINNAAGASAVNVQDGGNSLTVDNPTISVVGGGVEATAQRVTIASDSTGVLSVDDNGGTLTVDGSVTVSGTVDTELTTADLDTGAGTDTRAVVGLVLAASGGGLLVGSANPMPVSDNAGSLTVDNPILSVVGGGTEAAAQRVTIATDSTGVLSVDDNGASITVDNPALSVVGGGVEATALRVTVATDSTGVLSVDDNGGSLTIDNADLTAAAASLSVLDDWDESDRAKVNIIAGQVGVQGGAGVSTALTQRVAIATDANSVKLTDGTDTADVLDLVNSNPLTVAIVDANGDQITSFGGGTQYAEDSVHSSGDTVTMAGVVQKAADAALSNDGDRSLLQVDASGFLKVNIKAGAGSGGTAQADNSVFTEGTTSFTPIGGEYNDSPVSAVSGDAAAARITVKRALHVNLRDSSGNEVSVGGGTQYAEDTISGNADQLTMAGVVRQDNLSSLVNVAGDRTELSVDQRGALYVVLENDTTLAGLLAKLVDEQRATRNALLAGFEAIQYAVLSANNAPSTVPFLRLPPEDFDPDTTAPSELTN